MDYTKEQWSSLINIITNISSLGFTDIIIRDNKIRQLNDAKNLIINIEGVEFDNLEFQLAKAFIPLLKSFIPEIDKKIKLNIDTNFIEISDDDSIVKLTRPSIDLLSCDYLSDSRFSTLIETPIELVSFSINEKIISKTLAIRDIFSSTIFVLETKSSKTKFNIDSWKKTGTSIISTFDSKLPDGILKGNIVMFDLEFDNDPTFSVIQNKSNKYIAVISGKMQNKSTQIFSLLNT